MRVAFKKICIYMINLDIKKINVFVTKKTVDVRVCNACVTQSTSVSPVSHNKPKLCWVGSSATKL